MFIAIFVRVVYPEQGEIGESDPEDVVGTEVEEEELEHERRAAHDRDVDAENLADEADLGHASQGD